MRTVLCFGDSNTWGYDPQTRGRFPHDVRWTGVLARTLAHQGGEEVRVIEEGLPGRTTIFSDPIEGLAADRNGGNYLRPCLISHLPIDVVVLMLGTNDLKARFGLGASDIVQGIDGLLGIVAGSAAGPQGRAPAVLAIAPAPLTDAGGLIGDLFRGQWETSRRLAPMIHELALRRGVRFMDSADVWQVSPLDGVHFDAASHGRFGAAVAEHVRAILPSP